ncbi:MAG: PepSY domain-containing protein [Methanoregula sp.]|nr:PepSY domain-containing protein [Methanoregula sp.]
MRISHWKLILIVAVCCLALVSTAAAFQVNWTLYKSESQIPNVPSFENVPYEHLQPGELAMQSGQYPITIEEAKEKIRKYTGQPNADPILYRVDGLPIGSYYRMYVNASEYAVNQQTGEIEFVHIGENTVNSSMVNLTREDALAAAQAYAAEKYPGYSKKTWKLIRDGFYTAWWDDDNGQYYFTWREISGTVLTPNVIHVSVNPHNGKIIDYWGVERTINVELSPAVSQSEALEIAEDYYSWFTPSGLDAEYLTVITQSTNVQTLVYNVKLSGVEHWYEYTWPVHVMTFVNADNGDPMNYWSSYYWPEDWIGF